jgi:hypothetical protein
MMRASLGTWKNWHLQSNAKNKWGAVGRCLLQKNYDNLGKRLGSVGELYTRLA